MKTVTVKRDTLVPSSDGNDIVSPEFSKQHRQILKRKHRRLSLTQKASHNHERARLDLGGQGVCVNVMR